MRHGDGSAREVGCHPEQERGRAGRDGRKTDHGQPCHLRRVADADHGIVPAGQQARDQVATDANRDRPPPAEARAARGSRQTIERLAAAIRTVPARPAEPSTAESLARPAGLSRSAFAARFQQVFGRAPMGFVKRVRLRHAGWLLEATVLPGPAPAGDERAPCRGCT